VASFSDHFEDCVFYPFLLSCIEPFTDPKNYMSGTILSCESSLPSARAFLFLVGRKGFGVEVCLPRSF